MSVSDNVIEFRPSADFTVADDGVRDVALVFPGASLVVGVGDPKGQGWVTRVVGRNQNPDLALTAYNLGLRGDTSAGALARWQTEVPLRWQGRTERRLVISVGGNDVATGVSLARHRLNLANILDDAASTGVATFVVSPPPTDDQTINDKLGVLVEAQAAVCARRSVPFAVGSRRVGRAPPSRPGRLWPDRVAGAAQRLERVARPLTPPLDVAVRW